MQVTIGSIAAALLGFAGSDSKKEHQPTENLVEIIALILLPVAVLMVAYALMVFVWRAKAIAKKQVPLFSLLPYLTEEDLAGQQMQYMALLQCTQDFPEADKAYTKDLRMVLSSCLDMALVEADGHDFTSTA